GFPVPAGSAAAAVGELARKRPGEKETTGRNEPSRHLLEDAEPWGKASWSTRHRGRRVLGGACRMELTAGSAGWQINSGNHTALSDCAGRVIRTNRTNGAVCPGARPCLMYHSWQQPAVLPRRPAEPLPHPLGDAGARRLLLRR